MIIVMDGKHGSGLVKTAESLAVRFGIPCRFQTELPKEETTREAMLAEWEREGSYVFVGGAYSLGAKADADDNLCIFLNADLEYRKAYLCAEHGISAADAEREALQVDRERARAYGLGTGCKWTDIGRYDVCIDIGRLGSFGTRELINQLVAGLVMARRKAAY